jgi:hypothetical protein
LKYLTARSPMNVLNNYGRTLGGFLLMLPFPLVPFSNTLPALAILFFAIGLLEKDGIFILLGHLTNLATIFYFVFLILLGRVAIYGILN